MPSISYMIKRAADAWLGPAAAYRVNRVLDPPRFDGYVRIYPTLACNLRCDYCVNRHYPSAYRGDEYPLLPAAQWAEALNRIGRNVIITGGEPFLYPGIDVLLNSLREELKVKIYTNFAVKKTLDIMERVERPVVFLGSYHPVSGPPDDFIRTINNLRETGKFSGTIHTIEAACPKDELLEMKERFRQDGWDLQLDRDQRILFPGAQMNFRKKVECRRRIILVAPDGNRYQCVSKMLRRKEPLGNIFDRDPEPEEMAVICAEYGCCAPCDGLGETRIRRRKE